MSLKQLVFSLLFFNCMAWPALFARLRPDGLRFDFLSVGQGDSEVVSFPSGIRVVIDGGPDGSVLRELEMSLGGKKYIDVVILSHPHADHYVGLAEILERYDVGVVLLPNVHNDDPAFLEFLSIAELKGVSVVRVGSGDGIRSDDFSMKIISPSGGEGINDMNARSVVALLESGGVKALFTGDIGSVQEKKLAAMFNIDVDILKVAHHGSVSSSSAGFLKEASPVISVIEVGEGNRYGFPRKEVMDRLSAAGSVVYRTDTDGSIRIVSFEGKLKIIKLK